MRKSRSAGRRRTSEASSIKAQAIPTLTLDQVRSFWAENQGILVRLGGNISEVIRRTGWIYSSGGAGPYLAVRARRPGCTRAELDRAVFVEENVVEIPSVRGCTMLVPTEDAALALHSAKSVFESHISKVATACKISPGEIADLTRAVSTVLKGGALSSERLREILPKALVRPLGEAGRKFGENWNLSVVLRKMLTEGIIRRIATEKRLDGGEFCYRLCTERPAKEPSREEACLHLAHRFFLWAAPATIKEFAWWAHVSQREAKSAVERLNLQRLSIVETTPEAWISAEQLDRLRAIDPGRYQESVSLLPGRDNYLYFRRGLTFFLREADAEIKALDIRNELVSLSEQDNLHHNAILQGGLLAGAWEFDPDEMRIVWKTWSGLSAGLRKSLISKIQDLEQFIRAELGDAAFYSFDRGSRRRERIDSLR
ncbi:MAG TPA: crosslink repair DNA glycosylase YcaQ family protein [Acidobacteriota bacterium]|nr:crosslink repair DNA glycosylase YcaQ family protein [Acidobacteriota bacterium]